MCFQKMSFLSLCEEFNFLLHTKILKNMQEEQTQFEEQRMKDIVSSCNEAEREMLKFISGLRLVQSGLSAFPSKRKLITSNINFNKQ